MSPERPSDICAQVFFGVGEHFELRRFEPPDLGAAELLVRVDLAALCGSDLHTLAGTRTEPTPSVLGHEGVGTVVAVGPGAGVEVGRRVTWTLADSCGRCQRCTRDHLPQKCDHLFKYGHAPVGDGSGLNGTFASHVVLRAGTTVVPLPDEVSDAMAVSANCALSTMVAAWRAVRASVAAVDSVVIQGAGLLGVYGCALALDAGVATVICTDVDPVRLGVVEALGAIGLDGRTGDGVVARVRELVPGGVDAVIEAAGVAALLTQGVDMLRPGGCYGLVGLVHPDSVMSITAEAIIRRCLIVRGIHNYAPVDLIEAVAFLERSGSRFGLDALVSDPVDLEHLDDAVARARQRTDLRVTLRAHR
jgi:putative phosphonate catabolism associated alcohol dehydrogenase